ARVEAARWSEPGRSLPRLRPMAWQQVSPLSFAQERLWFLAELRPESATYNIPAAFRLSGELDLPALERSLHEIVRRHETLRTTFALEDGQPVQVIASTPSLRIPVHDLTRLAAERLPAAEAALPFDLQRGPLLRAQLLSLSAREHVALFTMHHIISDGWSLGILIEEIAALYTAFAGGAPSPLPEPPIQYADFAAWQREWLRGEALDEQVAYWKDEWAGAPGVIELPADRPRPPLQSAQGASVPVALDRALAGALDALAQQEGASLFMLLLAGFQALLHRYSGQDDVLVGSPIANRTQTEIEGLIGLFVNTLVLRGRLGAPALRFRDLLAG